jgi:gluconokinase
MVSMSIILMGVSGAGKTTIGKRLAADLGWPFYDGDDFHPSVNIDKMACGMALTDSDRWPWLDAIRSMIEMRLASGQSAIVTCSALKQVYRDRLMTGLGDVHFVYLKGDFERIQARLDRRDGHFMKSDLLPSQFNTLEEPEGAIVVDVSHSPSAQVQLIKKGLARRLRCWI